jgi:beta-phosphoglucomutase-like phosphatase (HAD superfamily)
MLVAPRSSPPLKLDPSVLERVLARTRARPGTLVVFDLDSTILDNRPRQARILREFGAARGIAKLADARPEHWQDWSLQRAMCNAGLPPDEAARLADDARRFWRERFFTSEYCRDDDAIAGARDFLAALVDGGSRIVYCTGRHEPMRAGTVASFERLGFPLPRDGAELLMKPVFELNDDAWKVEAHSRLRAIGEVAAVFDNEPTHVNGYRAAFVDAIVVHLATDDSGRPVGLSDGITSIKSFVRAQ